MNRLNGDVFRQQDSQMPRNDDEIDIGKLLAVLRRNLWLIILATVTGLGLGIAHVSTTTPLYSSQVDLNIGRPSDVDTFQDISGVSGAQVTEATIQTELEVLRSERIAERVVRMLDLHQNSTFLAPRRAGLSEITGTIRRQIRNTISSSLGWARGLIADDEVPDLPAPAPVELTAEELEARAIENTARRVRGGMSVTPVPNSRVVRISFTSTSPQLSARIANAIAEAYIDDQLDATNEASQRAIDWLRERRDQLRDQSERAEAIADRFRTENNLQGVDVNRATDAEFERLTANLVEARAELVELEARNRRLTEIVENEDTTAVVRETAAQGITSSLRARYLDTLSNYNNLVATLGESHAQTQRRLRELRDIEMLMFEEVRRSAELVRDDMRAARERLASLEAAQGRAGERVSADMAELIELRELERNAETVANLHASFQQRYQEATQRLEVPTSSARILNLARPGGQTSPNATRIQGQFALLGFILAMGFVAIREWRDDRVRTEDQVRNDLGLEYLGGLTLLKERPTPVSGRLGEALAQGKRVVLLPERLTFAADKPLSGFAETLRTGKMGLTLRHGKKPRAPRIGMLSCFPGEGKTTVAANFANLLAHQGARVMLVDGDMRNPGLTRATGKEFETGLVDILLEDRDWREIYHTVQGTGLHVLPNSKTRIAHSSELIGSEAMTRLLDQLDQEYDYVFVDLPPLGPVIDARALLDRLDGVFMVFKWGGTHRKMASRVLNHDPRLRDKCYGAFVNMVDPKKARAYEGPQSYLNYRSYYGRYYRET